MTAGIRHTVEFQPLGRRAVVRAGETLLDAAREAGIALTATCGGAGSCASCRVRLLSGVLSPVTDIESLVFEEAELAAGDRLACQAVPQGHARLHCPPDSLRTAQRLQLEALGGAVPDGVVGEDGGLGLAVDLGTTKIAMYLVELASGTTLASRAAPNPQVAWGEDVISRVAHASQEQAGGEQLTQAARVALADLAREAVKHADAALEDVRRMVVVGNTAMHHLLLGLPVTQLGLAPYRPAHTEHLTLTGDPLATGLDPEAEVVLPPVVAGFVGSDHVAVLLAAGFASASDTVLAVDIGTNTELSLLHRGQLLTCSTPSGPAFEGAHLSTGMRAAPGAVEAVRIAGDLLHWRSVDDAPPIGICGSGIVDLMAELLRARLLTAKGALVGPHPSLRQGANGPELVVVPARETGLGRDLTVQRRDLHEIALAKAAIRSAVESLLARADVDAMQVDRVVVAGAFGSYLDLESAVRIGMFPALPRDRFLQVGNAAGLGARQVLVSREREAAGVTLARRAVHVELSAEPGFRERYLDALWLPGRQRPA
ncbi:MAG: ASKHA domain-containing protein [Gemmatimonadales bacterium]